jgi:glycosyltransferase involved in cell wall biosynthesis
VVGDGPERAEARALAELLQLGPDDCRFVGERADVPHLLREAAVLVVTSDDEGSPNVILEAMAARVPVVTSPVGDAARLVGNAGMVVPDDEASAAALVDLARRPTAWADLGAAGRERVRRDHSLDRSAERWAAAWSRLARVSGVDRGRQPARLLGVEDAP